MEDRVTLPTLGREDWGYLPYSEAFALQNQRVGERLEGKIPDTLAFVEHPPVYTIGRRRRAQDHLIAPPAFLSEHQIEVIQTNRGGDITYHGPGQIVGYLFYDLRPKRDLHAILRTVESALIATLSKLGLPDAALRKGKTGVWFDTRKIAAIGMAARQWITFHGFALNHSPDLIHFEGIIPCGITDGTVTSITAEATRRGIAVPSVNVCKDLIHTQLQSLLLHHAG